MNVEMKFPQKNICVHLRSFAAIAFAAAICAHAAQAQVFGVRSFEGVCAVDQPVDVHIDLEVGDVVPNGVIIVEKLPVGWTLDSSTPPPSNLNTLNGEVRWMFFGAGVNDNLEIRYTTSGGNPATAEITGEVRFNNPEGQPHSLAIAGDAMCEGSLCVGDCNVDGTVTINEVLECLNVLLGTLAGGGCAACDANGDGSTSVDELITGVNNALNGCH
jgi:hypothetical protein